jgi:hypothetical protein
MLSISMRSHFLDPTGGQVSKPRSSLFLANLRMDLCDIIELCLLNGNQCTALYADIKICSEYSRACAAWSSSASLSLS